MCGNVLVDLDSRFSKFQFSYLSARQRGDYAEAAQILYEANATLPTSASIEDMPQFSEMDHGETLKDRSDFEAKAYNYCNKYAPLVWRATTLNNEQMMDSD